MTFLLAGTKEKELVLRMLAVSLQTIVLIRRIRNGASRKVEVIRYLLIIGPTVIVIVKDLIGQMAPSAYIPYVTMAALALQIALER